MPTNNAALFHIGAGAAQIIDTSPLEGGFQQLLAKQQAQRQLELKQLTDEQAQMKPDGLRNDADRQEYFKGVDDWKNKYIQSMNERDPYKKSLLRSQAYQAYMGLHSLVAQSKQQGDAEKSFGTQLLNPAVRDRYTPDAVNSYLKNKQLAVNDPNIVKDFNTYEQVADHSKTLDMLDKIGTGTLKQSQWGTPTLSRMKVGNRMATFINNSRSVDPKDYEAAVSPYYDTDQNVRKTFMDTYPDIYNDQTLTPAQQKSAAIQRYFKMTGGQTEYSKPTEKVDPQPDRFYDHYDYELANPKPGTAISNAPTPSQILFIDMQKGVPGTGEKLLSLAPKGQYGNVKPTIGIDKNTGVHNFNFPAQIDQKNKEYNDGVKAQFKKLYPNDPFDPTIPGFKLKPEVKTGAKTYSLNPNSPDYVSQAAQMALEQNINLSKLNQIEGIKGGHGQIAQAKMPGSGTSPVQNYTIKGKSYKAESVRKVAQASGMSVDEYLKAMQK